MHGITSLFPRLCLRSRPLLTDGSHHLVVFEFVRMLLTWWWLRCWKHYSETRSSLEQGSPHPRCPSLCHSMYFKNDVTTFHLCKLRKACSLQVFSVRVISFFFSFFFRVCSCYEDGFEVPPCVLAFGRMPYVFFCYPKSGSFKETYYLA